MRKRCRPTHQYCQRGVWSKCSEPKLSSNPHTASKHTIHEDFEVDETSSEVNDEEGGEPSCGCSDGSDGTHTPCEGRIAARCSQDRTTIESEPPMIRRRVPAAASRQHVVGGKTLVLARFVEATCAGTNDVDKHESNTVSSHVDDATSCEIEECDVVVGSICQPRIARPAPMDGHRVHNS